MTKKPSTPARSSSKPTETARKIWLAGLGAYGRAFSEAQESLARVSGGTSKVFDDLVEKGEQLEQTVEEKGRELARRVAPGGMHFDERIKQMRARLGISGEGDEHAVAEGPFNERLSALEAKVDRILELLEKKPASAKRVPAKKKRTTSKKTV